VLITFTRVDEDGWIHGALQTRQDEMVPGHSIDQGGQAPSAAEEDRTLLRARARLEEALLEVASASSGGQLDESALAELVAVRLSRLLDATTARA
jgi:hypothetical protein